LDFIVIVCKGVNLIEKERNDMMIKIRHSTLWILASNRKILVLSTTNNLMVLVI